MRQIVKKEINFIIFNRKQWHSYLLLNNFEISFCLFVFKSQSFCKKKNLNGEIY